jgi:transposase-like protein
MKELLMLNIKNLIDDKKCYETVRELRWADGVCCVYCDSKKVHIRGKDEKQNYRQRYHCESCKKDFDDLTNTVFAGHHQPLKTWILCLYFMGLNLSHQQIARELDLNKEDAQNMTNNLRYGVEKKKEPAKLSGEIEFDEVYVVAGHKGYPESVKKGRIGRRNGLKSTHPSSCTWKSSD